VTDQVHEFYKYVKEVALYVPELKGNLAGECANISNNFLPDAKQRFGSDVTIAIGWFELNERDFFKFSESDIPKVSGNKVKFNYHCWLQGSSSIIDLTIIETLRDMVDFDSSTIPSAMTCVGNSQMQQLGIKYHTILSGDNALFEFHERM